MNDKIYCGLDDDLKNGLGPTAKLVLDAKVFGLIGPDDTCKGWNAAGMQSLYDRVSHAWHPYGHLPSRLPSDLRERHRELYEAAIKMARDNGWDPDGELGD